MKDLLKDIIETYTNGKFENQFKIALSEYVEQAGKAINDSPEYEPYMQRFQAWFVFHWRDQEGKRLIEDYIKKNTLKRNQEEALIDVNFSFFEVTDQTKDHWVLYDHLHHKKLKIKDLSLVLMKDDLFIGRTVSDQEDFLLEGVCLVPKNLLDLIKRQCKKVRKLISLHQEEAYLLKLESLCLRANMYRNLNHESLFDFEING